MFPIFGKLIIIESEYFCYHTQLSIDNNSNNNNKIKNNKNMTIVNINDMKFTTLISDVMLELNLISNQICFYSLHLQQQ